MLSCRLKLRFLSSSDLWAWNHDVITYSDTKPTLYRDLKSADSGMALHFCWLKIAGPNLMFLFLLETTVWDEVLLCGFAEQLVTASLGFSLLEMVIKSWCFFINLNVFFFLVGGLICVNVGFYTLFSLNSWVEHGGMCLNQTIDNSTWLRKTRSMTGYHNHFFRYFLHNSELWQVLIWSTIKVCATL